MKRFLGLSLVIATVVVMVADTAEARFGRRRAGRNCCASQCQSGCGQNGCAPQGMAYHNQDPNMAAPGTVPPAPQPNTTFYRGNPDQQLNNQGQPLNNQGQPRVAPQVQGRTNLQGSANQNGIRANAETNVNRIND